ncbi:uncharacterized protein LOC132722250 [Ruditapes philippinarum]|uniref:uncharacterized protein LOC132722250 n=1 Tax=Ruditapes philippinarum TaxID=129788 RepID=UPI00295BC725|nr:uncharacterized protein LOC132722250 [Ruditapes philippinarum]
MALRLSICMLTGVFSRVFAGINMQYILYSSLSGYTCPDNRTLFDRMGVRSEIICAAKCTETRTCFGVFHRRQDMRCIGCEDKFLRSETTPLLNGTRYYRRKTYKLIDKKLTWSKSKVVNR